MTSDLNIGRAAKLLVNQHGEGVPIYAEMRVDELMVKGDLDGQAIWKLILKAIDELLANERPENAGLH